MYTIINMVCQYPKLEFGAHGSLLTGNGVPDASRIFHLSMQILGADYRDAAHL